MSLENEHYYWFLREQEGWIQGEKSDKDAILKTPPEDLILALDFHLYQSCSFAPEHRTVSTFWRHKDESRVESAISQYGKKPERYDHWENDGRG